MTERAPVIILGTFRSRLAWLSEVLSEDGRVIKHEPAVDFKGIQDLFDLLDRPGGAADAMLTLLWPAIFAYRPDAKIIVVRRPTEAVMASIRAKYPAEATVYVRYLTEEIHRQASILCSGKQVFSVDFTDLARNETVQAISRFALGKELPETFLSHYQNRRIETPLPVQRARFDANRRGVQRVFGRIIDQAIEIGLLREGG